MKLRHFSAIALIALSSGAYAQMNQIFGVLQSAQTAITQGRQLLPQAAASAPALTPEQLMSEKEAEAKAYSDQRVSDARARQQAKTQRQQEAAQRANAQMDADDQAMIRAGALRDAQRQQRDVAEAQAAPNPCPNANPKLGTGGYIVDCKNKGATEQQILVKLGSLPPMQQAIFAVIVQDIYDNNVIDPKKGNEIADYDFKCTAQNNCQRRVW